MAAAIICTVVFLAGLTRLFWMRFQRGDLYPPYSSLRSDPLGTQVFYESLAGLNPEGVQRNFKSLDQIRLESGGTLMVLGLSSKDSLLFSDMWRGGLDQIFKDGGRLILTFKPGSPTRKAPPESSAVSEEKGPKTEEEAHIDAPDSETETADGAPFSEHVDKRSKPPQGELDADGFPWKPLMKHLKISIHQAVLGTLEHFVRRGENGFSFLPEQVVWRSPYFFKLHDSSWQVVYSLSGKPAMVTRSWGKGRIFMSTDSYLFSNEALRGHRSAGILAWLVPPDRPVTVDEFHHGLAKEPGIAHLMRKYGLHGVAATLLVLTILLIWRQAAVFVPVSTASDGIHGNVSLGSDAREGWIRLMQQNIPNQHLLKVCHTAWRQSAGADRLSQTVLNRIESLTDKGENHDPVVRYREICQLLKQGKDS